MNFEAIKSAATPHLCALVAEAFPKGRKTGREWRTGSVYGEAGGSTAISLTDGRWIDHATGQSGDLISLWAERFGLGVKDAGLDLMARLGLSEEAPLPVPDAKAAERVKAELDFDERKRINLARSIWADAQQIEGTIAEVYLRSRGITLNLPSSLRYLPGYKHGPSGLSMGCMIGAVTVEGDKRIRAVHRTWLRRDGTDKANVNPAKMMLGPASGGAVRLAKAADELILGEGVETVLSAMQVSGLPGWACLSTGGLMAVKLPPLPIARNALIAADNDEPGLKAADECARRLASEGRSVRIAKPPEPGTDFNDILRQGGLSNVA